MTHQHQPHSRLRIGKSRKNWPRALGSGWCRAPWPAAVRLPGVIARFRFRSGGRMAGLGRPSCVGSAILRVGRVGGPSPAWFGDRVGWLDWAGSLLRWVRRLQWVGLGWDACGGELWLFAHTCLFGLVYCFFAVCCVQFGEDCCYVVAERLGGYS